MGPTRTKVDSGGRVVLPVEYRRSLGIAPGDEVVLVLREGSIHVLTPNEAVRRAQDLLAPYLTRDPDAVDELLEERRRERDGR